MEVSSNSKGPEYVLHFFVQPSTRNFLITDQSKLTEAAQVVPWLASMAERKIIWRRTSYWYKINRLDYA